MLIPYSRVYCAVLQLLLLRGRQPVLQILRTALWQAYVDCEVGESRLQSGPLMIYEVAFQYEPESRNQALRRTERLEARRNARVLKGCIRSRNRSV